MDPLMQYGITMTNVQNDTTPTIVEVRNEWDTDTVAIEISEVPC
jgi:hypothetical protein